MLDEDIAYTRLPARGRKGFGLLDPGRYELHLGPDHVLHLCRGLFKETYKRFYFDDVQAVVVSRTSTRGSMNLFLAVLSLVSVFLAVTVTIVFSLDVLSTAAVLALLAGIPLLLLAWNTALGPTCRCRLYTAVQTEDVAAMSRMRRAEATLAILGPLIEAAQGRLTPEALGADSEERIAVEASTHAAPLTVAPALPPTPLHHEHGAYHAACFWLLFAGGATILVDVFWQHHVKNLLDASLFLAEAIVVVLALRRQQNSDLPRGLRTVTWASLIVLIADLVLGMFMAMFVMFSKLEAEMASPEPQLDPFFALDLTFEGPAFELYTVVMLTLHTVVAVVGLLRLREFRAAGPQPLGPGATPKPQVGRAGPQPLGPDTPKGALGVAPIRTPAFPDWTAPEADEDRVLGNAPEDGT